MCASIMTPAPSHPLAAHPFRMSPIDDWRLSGDCVDEAEAILGRPVS